MPKKENPNRNTLPELWLGIARLDELDTFWVYPPIEQTKTETTNPQPHEKEPCDFDFGNDTWVESLHLEQKLDRT